jgi:Zn-dependent protease with chaperone function
MNKFKSLTLFLALLGVAPIASNSIPALNTEISEAPDDCGEFSKTLKSLDSGESSILESSYGFETCEQEALTEQDLKIILYDLYKISGLKTKPGIWQFPEEFDKENRYNVAIDDKKNIFVGTGILKTLSHEELKAVIAHELGHLKHNHIEHDKVTNLFSKLTLAFAASPLFAKLVLKNKIDLKIWLLFLFPRVVYEFWIIETMEREENEADAFSAEITKNPTAMASALRKMDIKILEEIEGMPFKQRLMAKLKQDSQPSTKNRIARLEAMAANLPEQA